eukprot:1375345-Rhodomonas_salina.1
MEHEQRASGTGFANLTQILRKCRVTWSPQQPTDVRAPLWGDSGSSNFLANKLRQLETRANQLS